MRDIVLGMSVSLDGYIEGPDRDIGWHRVDEELHRYFNAELAGMSAFIDGRVTHELMVSVWPTVDADPDCGETMAEFAGIWRNMPKIVFSRTLENSAENTDWNTTIVRDVVVEDILALKAQPGGDMSLGGAGLAATFMELDLVDEFRVYVHPVLIGGGKPLFPAAGRAVALRLMETRTFGNGVVMLRYRRAAETAS
ncbi:MULTISPECIES: dihydrofolate reductase family protein [unclassified Streptomyces]|uniref:dihydrofolate reductase family protein n=1 Tax=unclassified Streptomyces TaxID=2593676 RepID=UPI002DD8A91E|nr:dihydrofolate reductase family protein [Streptomyces sp. NBC_01445]WSE08762.1 dihydrofolate reductase family protein [Streptomyces sp. NBC_01445]